jgi:hypothetical protein
MTSTVVAGLLSACAIGLIQAPSASAMACMVNCFDENGGWQGGGGLGGGPASGVGGDPNPPGAGGLADASGELGGLGNVPAPAQAPSNPALCGGTDAVFLDYTVITSNCNPPPDHIDELGPDDRPAPTGGPTGDRAACEFRRDVVCDGFGIAIGNVGNKAGPVWGQAAGLAAKHMCRKFYTDVCNTYEP